MPSKRRKRPAGNETCEGHQMVSESRHAVLRLAE